MYPVELLPVDLAFAVALDREPDPLEPGPEPPRPAASSRLARRLREQILSLPGTDLPWGGFLAIDPDLQEVVGSCGFKGAPTPDHAIEIAYYTFPAFQGRGYATAMARALVEMAWNNPALRSVCAHTLPQSSASTRVLTKVGMRHVGGVHDPVEGLVWRWSLARPGPGAGAR